MITRIILAVTTLSFLAPVLPVVADEHPEHPRAPQPIIPSKPAEQAQAKDVTKADISAGIRKHIASETKKASDKKFHANYQGKDLAMDLVKVHDDRLSNLGGGKYFACVDMKATDGKTYDIDFFLTGQPGSMTVVDTSVHKINGKPLYNWKEENGVWKKVAKS
jgi:hypothetical protein